MTAPRTLTTLALLGSLACSRVEARDAGTPDAGTGAGTPDAGTRDAGDAGPMDAGAIDAGATLHVLFIGDSYTYVNDLPGMLAMIAATSGVPPAIATGEVVQGGASLEMQWDGGLAVAAILDGGWTQVVLQGQSEEPLGLDADASAFFAYARSFGDLAVSEGAQPTLFVTWARAAGAPEYTEGEFVSPEEMQDELTFAYAQVAQQWPQSILVCVGEAFERAIAQYPGIVLQQTDFSHPTVAGTYLAASTFYVALTGNPVPSQSSVPAGVSAEDAANLRAVAQIGTDCADVRPKGVIAASFGADFDGGPPFDFGTAGVPVPMQFELANVGSSTVDISDGMTLSPPFVWTAGGAFPGGSGNADSLDVGFCSSSLAPNARCAISVTYTAAATASGRLTLDFTDAYFPTATRALQGTATERALLTVCGAPGFFGCTEYAWVSFFSACPGETQSLNFFVMNRGALPVASLAEGTPLTPPFAWGGGTFPGGAGDVMLQGVSYPYCSATLGTGEQCVLTVAFSPADDGGYSDAINLAYSDAMGQVIPNANLGIGGACSTSTLPP